MAEGMICIEVVLAFAGIIIQLQVTPLCECTPSSNHLQDGTE